MTYAPDKYGPSDVIISVGCFTRDSLDQWQQHARCLVVDYEPTPELWREKARLEANNGVRLGRVECHNEAVSFCAGRIALYFYRGGQQGNTICTNWQPHVQPNEYFVGKMLIDAVPMRSVLDRFAQVRELWLNCEGSEIPILMHTPLELLERCQYISCEFHRFSAFLSISNGDVVRCVERLRPLFEPKLVEDYHPYYEFFRR